MTNKVRLISTISAICMVLALLTVGVWAVSTASVTLGGSVSFTADNVHARITGNVTGTQETISLPNLEYDVNTDVNSTDFQSKLSSWANNDMTFTSANLITMTITVENLSEERSLFVTLTDNTTTDNVGKTLKQGANAYTSATEVEVIAKGTTTFTMTLSVTDKNQSASAEVSYQVDLRDENYEEVEEVLDQSEYPDLKFNKLDEATETTAETQSLKTRKASVTRAAGNKFASVQASSTDISGEIVIPSKVLIDGEVYTVTEIADGDFNNGGAFMMCQNVTSIKLPDTLTTIGMLGFAGSGLTEITIPANVTSIGQIPFFMCTSLTNIKVDSKNGKYDSRDNCNAIIETATNKLLFGISNTLISNTVESIESNAFAYCNGLSSLTIPASVTTISKDAFYGCSAITSMNYLGTLKDWVALSFGDYDSNPTYWTKSLVINGETITSITAEDLENVTSIGEYAFYNCTSLTSIEIPNSVTSINNSAFYGCTGLASIEIPNSVKSINAVAFYGCTGLISATIGSGTTSIGTKAFSGCTGLTSVTIGSSVTSIGEKAFENCSAITSMNYLGDINSWISISFGSSTSNPTYYTKSLAINGEAITLITAEDFAGVTSIGSFAFYNCTGLTSVTIGSEVISIGDSVFQGCTGLASIQIPNSVTNINSSAFYGCTGLTSIEIPPNVTTIAGSLFDGCSGLENIEIPNGVTRIEGFAFNGCSGLTNVAIPEGLTNIDMYAFNGCTSLTSVRIPASVESIGNYAFDKCTQLTTIVIDSETVASGLTAKTSKAYLISYATTIYVKTEIVTAGKVGSYVTNTTNFPNVETITSGDYAGYTKYSK